jgi:hypothetical protein
MQSRIRDARRALEQDDVEAAKRWLDVALDREQTAQLPEIAGFREACEILGVRSSYLDRVPGLPPAEDEVKATRLWLTKDLRALARQRAATTSTEG